MRGDGKGHIEALPSGKHRATWYPPQGPRARKTFTHEEDAELWLAEKRLDVKRGIWQPPRRAAPTLEVYARQWIRQRRNRKGAPLKPRTVAEYLRIVERDWGDLAGRPVDTITAGDVREWYATLEDRPAAAANAYGLLASVMHTAADDDLILRSPCTIRGGSVKERASRTTVLTAREVVDLADGMPVNLRAAVHVAAFAGLRMGELFALRRADVDPDGAWVAVRHAVTHTKGAVHVGQPKSAAGVRLVTVPPHVAPILRDHLALWTEAGDDALVFTSTRGHRMRASTLYRHFYAARKAIGREDLRWHDLRHTGATMAAQAGATLAELQRRIGHSTVQAAMRYQHSTDTRDELIAARISEQATG